MRFHSWLKLIQEHAAADRSVSNLFLLCSGLAVLWESSKERQGARRQHQASSTARDSLSACSFGFRQRIGAQLPDKAAEAEVRPNKLGPEVCFKLICVFFFLLQKAVAPF